MNGRMRGQPYGTTTRVQCPTCKQFFYVMPQLLLVGGDHFHCPECGWRFDVPADEEPA